jgi:hypothetical protein
LALLSFAAIALGFVLTTVVHVRLNPTSQSGGYGCDAPAPITDQQPLARSAIIAPGAEGTPIGTAASALQEATFDAILDRIKVEMAKPFAEQSYAEIKVALAEVAARKDSGKVAHHAEYVLESLDWDCPVPKLLKQQLAEIRSKTQYKELSDRLSSTIAAQLSELRDYVVVGRPDLRVVGGVNWFRLLNDAGQTICYVRPATSEDYSKFIGRRVGLIGRLASDSATGRPVLEFTEIVDMP